MFSVKCNITQNKISMLHLDEWNIVENASIYVSIRFPNKIYCIKIRHNPVTWSTG